MQRALNSKQQVDSQDASSLCAACMHLHPLSVRSIKSANKRHTKTGR